MGSLGACWWDSSTQTCFSSSCGPFSGTDSTVPFVSRDRNGEPFLSLSLLHSPSCLWSLTTASPLVPLAHLQPAAKSTPNVTPLQNLSVLRTLFSCFLYSHTLTAFQRRSCQPAVHKMHFSCATTGLCGFCTRDLTNCGLKMFKYLKNVSVLNI